jgi:hypothetical protein
MNDVVITAKKKSKKNLFPNGYIKVFGHSAAIVLLNHMNDTLDTEYQDQFLYKNILKVLVNN